MLLSKQYARAAAVGARPARKCVGRVTFRCRAAQGDSMEPFSETAAQVKRLVQRDRKEFLGNAIDILDKYETEFGTTEGDSKATSSSTSAAAASASTATAAATTSTATASPPSTSSSSSSRPSTSSAPVPPKQTVVSSPFAASKPASSPFGNSVLQSPMYKRASIEPKGMTPDMGPDPMEKPSASPVGNIFSRITLTQVVLFLSFSTIIGIMIATFTVVVNTGAVRLAGI